MEAVKYGEALNILKQSQTRFWDFFNFIKIITINNPIINKYSKQCLIIIINILIYIYIYDFGIIIRILQNPFPFHQTKNKLLKTNLTPPIDGGEILVSFCIIYLT